MILPITKDLTDALEYARRALGAQQPSQLQISQQWVAATDGHRIHWGYHRGNWGGQPQIVANMMPAQDTDGCYTFTPSDVIFPPIDKMRSDPAYLLRMQPIPIRGRHDSITEIWLSERGVTLDDLDLDVEWLGKPLDRIVHLNTGYLRSALRGSGQTIWEINADPNQPLFIRSATRLAAIAIFLK